jgi:hypothetical protein
MERKTETRNWLFVLRVSNFEFRPGNYSVEDDAVT